MEKMNFPENAPGTIRGQDYSYGDSSGFSPVFPINVRYGQPNSGANLHKKSITSSKTAIVVISNLF